MQAARQGPELVHLKKSGCEFVVAGFLVGRDGSSGVQHAGALEM